MGSGTSYSGTRWRITLVYVFMAVLFFGALGRVFAISVIDHEKHAERSERNSVTKRPILAERGRIFSGDGQVLAQSIFSGTSVYINARAVPRDRRYEVAKLLAELLDLDTAKTYAKLQKHQKSAGLPVGHFLDDNAGAKVREAMDLGQLPGVHFRDRVERRYPKGVSAGQVIGFVNLTGQGSGGIEGSFNKQLSGEDGLQITHNDARKRGIASADDTFNSPKDGADIYTTIDSTIQEIVEEQMALCVEKWGPEAVMCVVMESKTGRILAMANAPSFNPARYHDADPESMKNRSLTDAWEPGSIFKPLLYSAAIEEGLVTKDSLVPYAKATRIGYRRVYDDYGVWGKYRRNADGSQSDSGKYIPLYVGLGKSLNVIASYIGESLYAGKRYPSLKYKQSFVDPYEGTGRFAKWVDRYGFGQYSGIDIGGGRRESKGIIPRPSKWAAKQIDGDPPVYSETVPSLSMGYGMQVTGIQMVSNFNVIANQGKRMRPYLVERITTRSGEVLLDRKPEEIADAGLSANTTDQVREMLEWIIINGTGRNARLKDYRLGGKTGTALILGKDGKYHDWKRRCSFISIGPIESPELTVLFSVQAPSKSDKKKRRGKDFSGGKVAAPYVGAIMQAALLHRGVEASKNVPEKD